MRQVHSHDSLLVFDRKGQSYGIKAYRIPEASITAKGRHIRNVIDGLDQEIHAVLALPERDPAVSVMTITARGQVKRSSIEDYEGATRRGGVIGLGLDEGDSLVAAFTVRDEDHVMLVTSEGSAIRFMASEIRVSGRPSYGVRGIKLDAHETVIGAAIIAQGDDSGQYLLCAGTLGVGKRTAIAEFPVQGRAGGGVIAFKPSPKTGTLVCAMAVRETQDLVMLASNGVSNRIGVGDVRESGRNTSGVILLNLDAGATLVSITTSAKASEEESAASAADLADSSGEATPGADASQQSGSN
jgi:DNA gyrase subunit A